jgi:hypothetical protein
MSPAPSPYSPQRVKELAYGWIIARGVGQIKSVKLLDSNTVYYIDFYRASE